MRHRNLASVGETGFLRAARLTVYNRHLMTGLIKKPGRCRTYDAGTQYDDFHDNLGILYS